MNSPVSRKTLFLPLLGGMWLAGALSGLGVGGAGAGEEPSLVPVFAALLGLWRWGHAHSPVADGRDGLAVLVLTLGFLIPSRQGGWLLLALAAGYLLIREPRERTGLMILLAAALHEPVITYLLKWFTGPVLGLDALLIASLLHLTTGVGSHIGNLVLGPAEHQLLILKGCSSLNNLGIAWLAGLSVALLVRDRLDRMAWLTLGMITLLTLLLNLIRLYGMALSLESHTWWHSELGMLVYQSLLVALVLAATAVGVRHVRAA